MNAAAYARMLRSLFPPGPLWFFGELGDIQATLLALADEMVRVDGRGVNVLAEADPRTATETLEDWEEMLALPDVDILAIPGTTAARRLAITQKLIKIGGQHPAYYIGLAAAAGYTVTITKAYATVLRSGFRSGARCYGTDWASVWQVHVQAPTGTALTHAELEAIIRRAAPAESIVFFEYL